MEPFLELLRSDRRYRVEAYRFVVAALDYAQNALKMAVAPTPAPGAATVVSATETPQHVTGQDLSRAACLYAQREYGLLARSVLNDMGILATSDVGEIVYNLIRIGQMNKTDDDTREDFDNVLDFDAFFGNYEIE